MALARCPNCGRVADGRSCFACGYDWPKGGVVAPAAPPTPHAPPTPASGVPGGRGPGTNPFQTGPGLGPPLAPTPLVSTHLVRPAATPGAGGLPLPPPRASLQAPADIPPIFVQAQAPPPVGAPQRAPTPSPAAPALATPGPASASPVARVPAGSTHNPFAQSVGNSNPFAAPPRAPTPMPRIVPPGALGMRAPGQAGFGPAQQFSVTPLIEVPPPAPPLGAVTPAPPRTTLQPPPPPVVTGALPRTETSGLSALFDDMAVVMGDPPTLSDPTNELDLLGAPTPSLSSAEGGSTDEASQVPDLVAAADATVSTGTRPGPSTSSAPLSGDGALDALFGKPQAFVSDTEQSTMSMPSPIMVRLRSLADRLRAEGRDNDADVVEQALHVIHGGGA